MAIWVKPASATAESVCSRSLGTRITGLAWRMVRLSHSRLMEDYIMKHDFPPHLVAMAMELLEIEAEANALECELRAQLADMLIAARYAGHVEHGLKLDEHWNTPWIVAESATVDAMMEHSVLVEVIKPQAARGLAYMMQDLPRYQC